VTAPGESTRSYQATDDTAAPPARPGPATLRLVVAAIGAVAQTSSYCSKPNPTGPEAHLEAAADIAGVAVSGLDRGGQTGGMQFVQWVSCFHY